MAEDKEDASYDQSENFWKQILNEVSNQSSRRTSDNKILLVLGNNGSGKLSLVSKLRSCGGKEGELKKGAGLQYTYLDVHNEDEYIRLGTWMLNGEEYYSNLLQYAITKDSVKNLTVLLCVDMSKPWEIIDNLENWYRKLYTHLHSLNLTAKERNEMERKILKYFQDHYKDMEVVDEEGKTRSDNTDMLSLDENVLVNNIGIPIIVILTKSDQIANLEKDYEYREEHFDFIQKHVRKFCLKSGAALMYASSKEGSNTSLLYNYVVHQIYGFAMNIVPQLVEKDTIFIPMGWDNENKIAIIDEHIKTFSAGDAFKDRIVKPVYMKPGNQEKEIVAEDDQAFLEAQLDVLSKLPIASPSSRAQPAAEHRVSPRTSNASPGQRAGTRLVAPQSKGKMEANKVAGENSSETVLANFFNSLLNKNTTGKMNKTAGPVANRSDVQAELERISKKTPTIKKE